MGEDEREWRFANMEPAHRKSIAAAIKYTLETGSIDIPDLQKEFGYDANVATQMMITLGQLGVIEANHPYVVTPRRRCMMGYWNQLGYDIQKLLTESGYSAKEIKSVFGEIPIAEKTEVSKILTRDHPGKWIDVNSRLPEPNTKIVIRMKSGVRFAEENATQFVPLEDYKVGMWTGKKWTVCGPHPFMDYSPLSNRAEISEEAVITHWRVAEDAELRDWDERFSPIGYYKLLNVEADKETLPELYRALAFGATFIAQYGGTAFTDAKPGEGLKKDYEILCDLASCIDRGAPIKNIPDMD